MEKKFTAEQVKVLLRGYCLSLKFDPPWVLYHKIDPLEDYESLLREHYLSKEESGPRCRHGQQSSLTSGSK